MTDLTATPGDEQTATILVDRTSSTCGGCGKPTLPSALTHANVSGYDPKPGGGCGARYTAIRSANRSVTEEHLRSLRPDLPVDPARGQQMTDRPYTDEDLRAEAAKQHYTATTDPDFMGIGEQMEDSTVASTEDGETGLTWHELLVPEGGGSYEAYGEVQRAIDDLLGKAADVSEWAINLGADGLEPTAHTVSLDSATLGGDFARLHLAFHPDVPEADRVRFTDGLRKAIEAHL